MRRWTQSTAIAVALSGSATGLGCTGESGGGSNGGATDGSVAEASETSTYPGDADANEASSITDDASMGAVFAYQPCPLPAAPAAVEPCGTSSPCASHSDDLVGLGDSVRSDAPSIALVNDLPLLAYSANGGLTLASRDTSGWTQVNGPAAQGVGMSNARGGAVTVETFGVTSASYFEFSGGALKLLQTSHAISGLLLRDGCGDTLDLYIDRANLPDFSWMSIGPTPQQVGLPGSIGGADMALAANGDLHVVYTVGTGSNIGIRWLYNGSAQGDTTIQDGYANPPMVLGTAADAVRGSVPHVVYQTDAGTLQHIWPDATGSWQQQVALSDDLSHDCLATPPTATATDAGGQVCNEDATRHVVVDAAMGPGGATRWIAVVTHDAGTYTSYCWGSGGDGGGCGWNPSGAVTKTQSISIGALQGGQLQFSPVTGLSWPVAPGKVLRIGRGGSAIDSSGGIHIAYALQTGPSGVEEHHLLVAR